MFRIIGDTHIPFMSIRRRTYVVSALLIIVGFVSLFAHKGLKLGVDFAGGRLFEYQFSEPLEVDELRSVLDAMGIAGGEVQEIGEDGTDFIVRIPIADDEASVGAPDEEGISTAFASEIEARHPGIQADLRLEELVGPRIGAELRGKAFRAVGVALFLILLYVGFRFEFKFALGGVAALAHDVLLTVFVFSLFDIEFTIPIVAALLTIGGYSINDTVVVFDRIRERSRTMIGSRLEEVMDTSINEVLSRTLVTSITTFFSAGALWLFGGQVIHDFAFAILIGIVVGTYSSIYVASAIALEISKNEVVTAPEA